MLAAYYEETGPSAVIRVGQRPTPEPGPGEVRVRIVVSGINPTDWKARASGQVESDFQIPNQDGAGVIEAVGEGVGASRVGERVWVFFAAYHSQWGTAAEYTVVPAGQAVRLPDNASFELGAAIGIPAMTAHRCLFADGPIGGKAILVAGGAGAVGRSAVELARWADADRIIATVSSQEKAEIAQAAGATHTVDYRAADAAEQLRRAAPDGVDRIVELSLGDNFDLDLAGAARYCVITSYANEGPEPTLATRALMSPNISLRFMLVYTMPQDAIDRSVADITDALANGALTEPQLHRLPLEQAGAAHDAVEAGATGKVLIDVPG